MSDELKVEDLAEALVCMCHQMRSTKTTVEVDDGEIADEPIGNWRVTVERVETSN